MDNAVLPQGMTARTISLWLGHPDPSTLNTPAFQEAVQRVMASPRAYHALEYGSEQGNPALIDYLVNRINREQQAGIRPENVMITAGSTNAVDMIARLYTQPDDAVLVEAPTYTDSLHVFRDHGVQLHAVPIDHDGIMPAEFEKVLKVLVSQGIRTRLLYTIPNFHNPTGITTTEQRRKEIVSLARQYDVTIVEDDVYRDLAFETTVPPSYFSLADGVNVIQIGSFSKTIAPGLRVGWIVADADAVKRFVNCGTTLMGGGSNPLAAQIVAEYCHLGYWDAHLGHIRRLYQTRRDSMLAALSCTMPSQVRWTNPSGGFFVWMTLPEGRPGAVVKAQASARDVLVGAGESYFVNPADGQYNLRLAYSFAPLNDIETAIHILADVISG